MDSNWKKLIEKYADGRPICNCGCAYYTPCGHGIDRDGNQRGDMLACAHGCSANQINARDEIAGRVMADLANNEVRDTGGDDLTHQESQS